jgi:hypothetical protein
MALLTDGTRLQHFSKVGCKRCLRLARFTPSIGTDFARTELGCRTARAIAA